MMDDKTVGVKTKKKRKEKKNDTTLGVSQPSSFSVVHAAEFLQHLQSVSSWRGEEGYLFYFADRTQQVGGREFALSLGKFLVSKY